MDNPYWKKEYKEFKNPYEEGYFFDEEKYSKEKYSVDDCLSKYYYSENDIWDSYARDRERAKQELKVARVKAYFATFDNRDIEIDLPTIAHTWRQKAIHSQKLLPSFI